MKKILNKNHGYLVTIILLSILGSLFLAWYTRNGPRGWSDSVAYLVTARNIIRGIWFGYYFPDGRFYTRIIQAPLYPIVLAFIGILKVDLISGARALNILLFGGTVFFSGLIFYKYSNHPWLSVIACILVGTFPVFFEMYTEVMTEPLFFFLFFFGLYCLFHYMQQNRTGWLITAGIIMGLLFATRYIGFVFILTSIVVVLLFSKNDRRFAFKPALLFGLISSIPVLSWGIYLFFFTESIARGTATRLNWDLLISRFADFRGNTIQLIWKWVPFHEYILGLKTRYQYLIILAIICTIALVTYFAKQKSAKTLGHFAIQQEYILYIVFGCFSLGLFAFMIFSSIFFQLPGHMDNRQLMPVFLCGVLSIISAFALWIKAGLKNTTSWKTIAAWGIALLLLFLVYPQNAEPMNIINLDQGLMASSWNDSETMNAVRQIPSDTPIVSNNAAALLYWADHPAYEMMEILTPEFIGETTPYGSDKTDRAQRAFHDGGGILVVFNNFPTQMAAFFNTEGTQRINTIFSGLLVKAEYNDGIIYTSDSEIIP